MKKTWIALIAGLAAFTAQAEINPADISTTLSLKVPGNASKQYTLSSQGKQLVADTALPLKIKRQWSQKKNGAQLTLSVSASEPIWFRISQELQTSHNHQESLFYMPGFWYRHNLRSPKEAPSFHTADSWTVREDRLSTPLTGVYGADGSYTTVIRKAQYKTDALSTHYEGEIMLSGPTDLGYTGFENQNGKTTLCFGFPYQETPKAYIRKLTLAPEVYAFQKIEKGQTLQFTWEIQEGQAQDYSGFIRQAWEYSYDTYRPQNVETPYTVADMKEAMSQFFLNSYTDQYPLAYYSGEALRTADCDRLPRAEIGFVGRTLLNAYNALEYGEATQKPELVKQARKVLDSYEKDGFSKEGFFHEFINFQDNYFEPVHSIRRQSEGAYAILRYLQYDKAQGISHPKWEERIRTILDQFLKLQNADGSFPRKFKDDASLVDASGGSTPSATLPLVMAYKYFNEDKYLQAAKRTASYLEKEIISKADYFSSTLDANCEDKEASLYAATATYYLALVTKGQERAHYTELTQRAAYFALSWYYTYDVPFAEGQMLGDLGLKSRGWGNVSVENNHIDVFVFEFAQTLHWLSQQYDEKRFADFADVMASSMKQLLPIEGNLCGIAKVGFYPEVVQHTHWDYGRNGKGYYNNIFAPGWTVASLWELYTPGRTEEFLK